jgi:hypothetical protein
MTMGKEQIIFLPNEYTPYSEMDIISGLDLLCDPVFFLNLGQPVGSCFYFS